MFKFVRKGKAKQQQQHRNHQIESTHENVDETSGSNNSASGNNSTINNATTTTNTESNQSVEVSDPAKPLKNANRSLFGSQQRQHSTPISSASNLNDIDKSAIQDDAPGTGTVNSATANGSVVFVKSPSASFIKNEYGRMVRKKYPSGRSRTAEEKTQVRLFFSNVWFFF